MLFFPSSSTAAAFLSLLLLVSALPFHPLSKDAEPEPLLIPRASYSVVPVDGGVPSSTAAVSPDTTTTVIETITQSPQPQATLTIISTEIVPAGIDTLTSIMTVTAQDTTGPYISTFIPATATVTVTASSPIATAYNSAAAATSTAYSTLPGTSNCTSTSTTMTSTSSPVSSTTYDDGFWHTTYPVWSNSSSATASGMTLSPSNSLA